MNPAEISLPGHENRGGLAAVGSTNLYKHYVLLISPFPGTFLRKASAAALHEQINGRKLPQVPCVQCVLAGRTQFSGSSNHHSTSDM